MLKTLLGRCTLYYIAGLLLAYYYEIDMTFLWQTFLIFLGLLCYLTFLHSSRLEIFFVVCWVIAGCAIGESHIAFHKAVDFQPYDLRTQVTIIRLEGKSTYTQRYLGKVHSDSSTLTDQQLLIEVPAVAKTLLPGSIIDTKAKLYPLPQPLNPEQFDYGRFLKNKGYFARLRLKDSLNWQIVGVDPSPQLKILRWSALYHQHVQNRLISNGWTSENQGVFMALLLGQKQDLNSSTKSHFQRTGLMHLLAVSGLHLGLVLLFAKRILMRLSVLREKRTLLAGVLFVLLSLYAVLTGFSPSVVRALVLFGVLLLSRLQRRNMESLHALSLAAFITLLIDPTSLLQLGFQMSYAAVFFILWFNKSLRNFKLPIPQALADGFRVSLAAQLGVLPLSLWTFNQFSASFLLSNLAALPLFSPLLGVLWLQLLFLEIPHHGFLGSFGEITLKAFLGGLQLLSNHSWSIENIPFQKFELYLLYASFACLGFYVQRRTSSWLFLAMGFFVCQQLGRSWSISKENQSTYYLIPHAWGKSALIHKNGRSAEFYSNSSDWNDFHWAFVGLQQKKGLEKGAERSIPSSGLQLSDTIHLLRLGDPLPLSFPGQKYLWVQDSPHIHFEEALDYYRPDLVIADGSNASYLLPYWEKSCRKYRIPFYSTQKKGAFIMDSL